MRIPVNKPHTSTWPAATCDSKTRMASLPQVVSNWWHLIILSPLPTPLLPPRSQITWFPTIRNESFPICRNETVGGKGKVLMNYHHSGKDKIFFIIRCFDSGLMVEERLKRQGRPSGRWGWRREINNASGDVWVEERGKWGGILQQRSRREEGKKSAAGQDSTAWGGEMDKHRRDRRARERWEIRFRGQEKW